MPVRFRPLPCACSSMSPGERHSPRDGLYSAMDPFPPAGSEASSRPPGGFRRRLLGGGTGQLRLRSCCGVAVWERGISIGAYVPFMLKRLGGRGSHLEPSSCIPSVGSKHICCASLASGWGPEFGLEYISAIRGELVCSSRCGIAVWERGISIGAYVPFT